MKNDILKNRVEAMYKMLPERYTPKNIEQLDITPSWVTEEIDRLQKIMYQEKSVGIPWVIMFGLSLFFYGWTIFTIILYLLGMTYFIISFVKSGSYGGKAKIVKKLKSFIAE